MASAFSASRADAPAENHFTGGNEENGEDPGIGFEHQEHEASEGRQVCLDLCGPLRPSC
jgi:hypothetical protein